MNNQEIHKVRDEVVSVVGDLNVQDTLIVLAFIIGELVYSLNTTIKEKVNLYDTMHQSWIVSMEQFPPQEEVIN